MSGARRTRIAAVLLGAAVLLCATGVWLYVVSSQRGLPYRDSFAAGRTDGWVPYSGDWRVADGGIKNDSIDPGAKLMAGSSHWDDYSVEADVELLGEGDAGLVIRASDMEAGADSYRGYYAGLRTRDGKLVLGRADHGWTEFPSKKMPWGVTPGERYHLKLSAYGCKISIVASELEADNRQSVSVDDPHCFAKGKFGLRSLYAGGEWSNVHATRLEDAEQARQTVSLPPPALDLPAPETTAHAISPTPNHAFEEPVLASPVRSIRNLRLLTTTHPVRAFVRGAVILTEPLYIQDANGGVRVEMRNDARLRSGEEVEVEGNVYVDGLTATIRDATVRSMGGGIATRPPLSVTADQAATGAYQAMFVEVQGTLRSKVMLSDGREELEIHDGQQTFYAVGNSELIERSFEKVAIDSLLKLRGVCLVDAAYTRNLVPFALLVISKQDVKILAGPPWWSAGHLIEMALLMLGLGFVAHLLYSRAEEWRLRAVIEERERLAHEIHDTLAQSFAGIGFQLRAIVNRVSNGKHELNPAALVEELNRACDLVRQSHDEARRTITTLRPDATEAGGLIAALRQTASQMVGPAHVEIETFVEGELRSTPLQVLDSLFRIGQEAIANAIQHGHPTRLRICATYTASAIKLLIEDNGRGFVPGQDSDGFGLTGIRRRAEAIQGTLAIETAPGKGPRLMVEVPMTTKRRQFWSLPYHVTKSGYLRRQAGVRGRDDTDPNRGRSSSGAGRADEHAAHLSRP